MKVLRRYFLLFIFISTIYHIKFFIYLCSHLFDLPFRATFCFTNPDDLPPPSSISQIILLMEHEDQETSQYYRCSSRDSNCASQKRATCHTTRFFVFSRCAKRIVFLYLAMVRQGWVREGLWAGICQSLVSPLLLALAVKIKSLLKLVYHSTNGDLFLLVNVYFWNLFVVISPYHVSGRCKFDSPAKVVMFAISVWGRGVFCFVSPLYSSCYMFCENRRARLD
jgi:hypothetical protein